MNLGTDTSDSPSGLLSPTSAGSALPKKPPSLYSSVSTTASLVSTAISATGGGKSFLAGSTGAVAQQSAGGGSGSGTGAETKQPQGMKLDDFTVRSRAAVHVILTGATPTSMPAHVHSFVVDNTANKYIGGILDEFCSQLAVQAGSPAGSVTKNQFQFEEQNSGTQIQPYDTISKVMGYAGVNPNTGSAYVIAKKIA